MFDNYKAQIFATILNSVTENYLVFFAVNRLRSLCYTKLSYTSRERFFVCHSLEFIKIPNFVGSVADRIFEKCNVLKLIAMFFIGIIGDNVFSSRKSLD